MRGDEVLKHGSIRTGFAALGLVAIALASGCGRDQQQVFDAKLAEIRAAAMKDCAKEALESASATLDQAQNGCARGFEAAKRVARAHFNDAISIATEQDEHVARLHLEPIDAYLSSKIRPDGFDGSDWICRDSAGPKAAPAEHETVDICRKGARAAFVELGRSCGVDLEKIAPGKSETCVIHREPIAVSGAGSDSFSDLLSGSHIGETYP
jgi:hypothetical protein